MTANQVTDHRDHLSKDSWGMKDHSTSQQASPRSKYTKVNYTQSEYQIILHFVKSNLKLLLRLISSDIHNNEVSLSAAEFNTLRILFRTNTLAQKSSQQNMKALLNTSPKNLLASLTPFYSTQQHTVKVHMNQITDWLLQAICHSDTDPQTTFLDSLNKCVMTKDAQFRNKDLRVQKCEDSYIYVNTNVEYVQITSCVNCTIFVAAVNKAITIDKCENVTVCVASHFLRIGNCVDCTFYTYSQQCPPVIYGDSRNVQLGPHNAHYKELEVHLHNAELSAQVAQKQCYKFGKPLVMKSQGDCFSVVQAIDFMKMALPSKIEEP